MANATSIEQHPDIMELRARYERAAETPQARVLEGCAFLAGLYIAISPWVVGFSNLSTITVNNLIVGIALGILALGFTSAYSRTHNLTWVAPILGGWIVAAPWGVLGTVPTAVLISNVIAGGITVLVGLGMIAMEAMGARRVTMRGTTTTVQR